MILIILAVGGFDQSRKAKAPTKSIEPGEEAEKSEKAMEFEKEEKADMEGAKANVPAPAVQQKEAPAPASREAKGKDKDKPGSHKNGGQQGKEIGQTRSDNTKSKEKPKK